MPSPLGGGQTVPPKNRHHRGEVPCISPPHSLPPRADFGGLQFWRDGFVGRRLGEIPYPANNGRKHNTRNDKVGTFLEEFHGLLLFDLLFVDRNGKRSV